VYTAIPETSGVEKEFDNYKKETARQERKK
jgi:hypothetical protein